MGIFESKFTNIFGDGQISATSPDAEQDWFYITDYGQDHDYWQSKIADAIKVLTNNPTIDCQILYGGEVTDGGAGTVDISEGVALGKDYSGEIRFIHIPALTGVSLPSGWNTGKDIWIIGQYDFKLSSSSRNHYNGTSYYYQTEDTYIGDINSENTTSTDDMFVDSDPNATPDTIVVWGKFQMNGTSFTSKDTDANGRTDYISLFVSQGIIMADGATIGQATGPLLTFNDTSNLLGITGCKTGFGTLTPDSAIEVSGAGTQIIKVTETGSSVESIFETTASYGWVGTLTSHPFRIGSNGNSHLYIETTGKIGVGVSNTPNEGINLLSSYNLSWTQNATESLVNIFRQANSASTIIGNGVKYSANAGAFASSYGSSWAHSAFEVGNGVIKFFINTASTVAVGTDVTMTERMRIDSTGNMAIGKSALEAWHSGVKAVQFGGTGSIMSSATEAAGAAIYLIQNAYSDSVGWKYMVTDEASFYRQIDGTHVFGVAVSGTADTAVPWVSGLFISSTGQIATGGETSPNVVAGGVHLEVSATGDAFVIKNGATEYFAITNLGAIDAQADALIHTLTVGLGKNSVATNTAIGYQALVANTTGAYNTAIGYQALVANTTGAYNTAIGYQALVANTTGIDNTAIGYHALSNVTVTSNNIAIGYSTLTTSTANSNIAIGYLALRDNTTGTRNVAIGIQTLMVNTTGSYNTMIGYISGETVTTGENLTCVGYNAQPTAVSATNEITLGNGSVTSLRCAVTTITAISDKRDKIDIENLDIGLDFIRELKPRKFKWDKREWYAKKNENNRILKDKNGDFIYEKQPDGTRKKDIWDVNFIAQELEEVQEKYNVKYLNLVSGTKNQLEANTLRLFSPLIKAVQELADKNDILEKEIKNLKNK